jgi:hypothetical protein
MNDLPKEFIASSCEGKQRHNRHKTPATDDELTMAMLIWEAKDEPK